MSNPKKSKPAQADKDKKPKLVRDSFTIPKNEYAALDNLKARALAAGVAIKKSELLRAGLMTLCFMSDAAFKSALAAVPTLKTGRPAQQPETAPAVTRSAPAPAPVKAQAPVARKRASTAAPVVKKTSVQAAPVKTALAKKVSSAKPVAAKPAVAPAPAARKAAAKRSSTQPAA